MRIDSMIEEGIQLQDAAPLRAIGRAQKALDEAIKIATDMGASEHTIKLARQMRPDDTEGDSNEKA